MQSPLVQGGATGSSVATHHGLELGPSAAFRRHHSDAAGSITGSGNGVVGGSASGAASRPHASVTPPASVSTSERMARFRADMSGAAATGQLSPTTHNLGSMSSPGGGDDSVAGVAGGRFQALARSLGDDSQLSPALRGRGGGAGSATDATPESRSLATPAGSFAGSRATGATSSAAGDAAFHTPTRGDSGHWGRGGPAGSSSDPVTPTASTRPVATGSGDVGGQL